VLRGAIVSAIEDAATAEISRAQLGELLVPDLYRKVRDEELAKLGGPQQGRLREATEVLDGLVLSEEFGEFLTNPAYRYLD